MKKYDFVVVGAGLYGLTFANLMHEKGKKVIVIDRRPHIAGNAYSENISGIEVHMYGPHIFHTDKKKVWDYVNRFAQFNHFRFEPLANYKGQIFHLPFNMNTFHEMWGIVSPKEAEEILNRQRKEIKCKSENLEEQAISLVGRDIYEKLIKGYTEKQWGRKCCELSPDIIKRLPVRMRYDNNYFNHPYQGIPVEGYTNMAKKMADGIDVILNADFLKDKQYYSSICEKILYTGAIDEFFDYCYGELQYRSLKFVNKELNCYNYQGVAAVNYTDSDTPYTRIIEHKHFVFGTQETTVITEEYPVAWTKGLEPFYPINDERNAKLYERYTELAKEENNIIWGGRMAEYKYYDMDQVIYNALMRAEKY